MQPNKGKQQQSPRVHECVCHHQDKAPLPLEDAPLIGIPNPDEAQSVLIPISTMSMAVYKNEVMSNLKYEYKTHYLKPLHPESHNHRPKITTL